MAEAPIDWVDTHIHLIDRNELSYSWLDDYSAAWEEVLGDYHALQRDFSLAEFLVQAKDTGLGKIVHVEAAFGSDPARETAWLQTQAAAAGLPFAVIGRADLTAPDVAAVLDRQMAYPDFRGVRMLWGAAGDVTSEFRRGFAALVDRDLLFEEPSMWEAFPILAGLADDYPEARIVLGHCGMPLGRDATAVDRWRRALDQLARRPNVTCKISGVAMTDHAFTWERFKRIVDGVIEAFGHERCFFGSNWPVESLYFATYAELIEGYRALIADRPATERRALLSDNGSRVYRL